MEPPQSQPSSPRNDKRKKRGEGMMGWMNEDVVQNILERLPAASFAFASCVSRSWYRVSRLVLSSRPALASALSLNPSPTAALEEVVEKVLSAPIRPDFALAHVSGSAFGLNKTLLFLGERLGWSTPIVVTRANGIMGRNVATSEYLEVSLFSVTFHLSRALLILPCFPCYIVCGGFRIGCQFKGGDDVHDHGRESKNDNRSGMVLTVGFLPGIKVGVFPLLHPKKEMPNNATFQKFLTDIKSFSASASDSSSPAVIMMFGNRAVDQKPIINQLDKALSKETIILGDERTQFSYRTGKEPKGCSAHTKTNSDSVSLVLARDSNKPRGTGEIKFHSDFSRGLSALGPVYRAVSVRTTDLDRSTWLTAKRDGNGEILDGTSIMSEINDELERYVGCPELYIGISRRRKCFTGCEQSTLTFHGLLEGNEDYLTVDGIGIRTRDYFQFYMSDPDVALSSCNAVTEKIKNLKLEWNPRNPLSHRATASDAGREFIGGLVFACCGRGESFFARTNVDSSPFLENFPEAPLAGIYCCGETARGISTGYPGHCCTHVYSSVYLGFSYTPASLQE